MVDTVNVTEESYSYGEESGASYEYSPIENRVAVKPPNNIGELATTAGIIGANTPEEADAISDSVEQEYITTGSSRTMSQTLSRFRQSIGEDFYNALIQDIDDHVLHNEERLEEIRSAAAKEQIIDVQDPVSLVIAEEADTLTPEAQRWFGQFSQVILPEVLHTRNVDNTFQMATESLDEDWKWYHMLGAVANPFQAGTGRWDQNKFVSALSDSLDVESDFTGWSKASMGSFIDDFFDDEHLSLEERRERLDDFFEFINTASDELNLNPLWTAEMMHIFSDRAMRGRGSVGLFTDVVDYAFFPGVGAAARSIARSSLFAKRLGKVALTRARIKAKGGAIERADALELSEATEDLLDALSRMVSEFPEDVVEGVTGALRGVSELPLGSQMPTPPAIVAESPFAPRAMGTGATSRDNLGRARAVSDEVDARQLEVRQFQNRKEEFISEYRAGQTGRARSRANAERAYEERLESLRASVQQARDAGLESTPVTASRGTAPTAVARAVRENIRQGRENLSVGRELAGRTGSLGHHLANANPILFARVIREMVETGNEASLARLGLTTDDVLTSSAPLGNGSGMPGTALTGAPLQSTLEGVSPSRQEAYRNIRTRSLSDVLTNDELSSMAARWSAAAASRTRSAMHVSKSEIVSVDDTAGAATLRALFGKDASHGYSTYEEATYAARDLFGGETRILARPLNSSSRPISLEGMSDTSLPGHEFFIETTRTMQPTANLAGAFTDGVTGKTFSSLVGAVIPNSSRVEPEIFDLVSSLVDSNHRLGILMKRMARPISSLRSQEDLNVFNALMNLGDEHAVVFQTRQQAAAMLGEDISAVSPRAWEAYKAGRELFDTIGEIMQRDVYNRLAAQDFRGITLRGGRALEDADGPIFGRPITSSKVTPLSPSQVDGTNPIPREQLWGNSIWDATEGRAIPLNSELAQQIGESSDRVIVALSRSGRFIDEASDTTFPFAIVNRSSITELPANPVRLRTGHVDRKYWFEADGMLGRLGISSGRNPSFVVRVRDTVIEGGIARPYERVVGVGRDRAEAHRAAEHWRNQMLSAGPTPAGRLDYTVAPSRELISELGLPNVAGTGGTLQRARHRGDQVFGPSGIAETMQPAKVLESLSSEARRITGREATDVMKARFTDTFRRYVDEWNDDWSAMEAAWKRSGSRWESQLREAKARHQTIRTLEVSLGASKVSKLGAEINRAFLSGLQSDNRFVRAWSNAGLGLGKSDIAAGIAKYTAMALVGMRPFFQIAGNALIASLVSFANPLIAIKHTVPKSMGLFMGLLARFGNRIGNKGDLHAGLGYEIAARMFSPSGQVSAAQMKRITDHMVEGGLLATSFGNDFIGMMNSAIRVSPNTSLAGSIVRSPLKAIEGLGSMGYWIGGLGIDFSKVVGYAHAMGRSVERSGYRNLATRRSLRENQADAQRLNFNQNKMDEFTYQHNVVGLQLQLMQHVQRFAIQTIVDPSVRVATLGRLGVGKLGTNPFYDKDSPFLGAMKVLLGMTGLFGGAMVAQVTPWSADDFKDTMKEMGVPEEAAHIWMDGVVGGIFNQIAGTRVDSASRFSPIGWFSSTVDLMTTDDGGVVLGGPGAFVFGSVANAAKMANMVRNTQELSLEDSALIMSRTIARLAAGFRDYEKAMLIRNHEKYMTSQGRVLTEVVPDGPGSWITTMMSIPDAKLSQYYRSNDMIRGREEEIRFYVRVSEAIVSDFLNDIPKEDRSGESTFEALRKGFALIDAHLGDTPAAFTAKNQLERRILDRGTPLQALMDRLDTIVNIFPAEEAIDHLREIKNVNPQAAEAIDAMFINPLLMQIEAQQGETQ